MYGGSAGGYTAQAIGLEYTTASRGAFTGTFTVLAVPILVRPPYVQSLECLSRNTHPPNQTRPAWHTITLSAHLATRRSMTLCALPAQYLCWQLPEPLCHNESSA